jgi:hypothetical protein
VRSAPSRILTWFCIDASIDVTPDVA